MSKIAHELRTEGIPARRGGKWWPSTVKKIPANALYAGEASYGGVRTDGQQEAVITKRTLNKV